MVIYQSHHGYCYNSDSIFLADFILSFNPKGKMLDVGCGVGVVGIVVAKSCDVRAYAIDKQHHMSLYAKQNYHTNKINLVLYNDDFLDFETSDKFDLIVSNPPFYGDNSMKSQDTKLSIARYAHNLPIDDFFRKVHLLLKPQGRFYFCYDSKYLPDLLASLQEYKLTPEFIRFVHSKRDNDSKLVMIACRHNSKAISRIMSPLIVLGDDMQYTTEANDAFARTSLHSIKGEMYGV